jgi:hypothetical protein
MPLAQVGKDEPSRRICSIATAETNIHVSFGELSSSNTYKGRRCRTARITSAGAVQVRHKDVEKCAIIKQYVQNDYYRSAYWMNGCIRFPSKAGTMFAAFYDTTNGKCTINTINLTWTNAYEIKSYKTSKLMAFDAAVNGHKFVIVEEAQEPTGEKSRKVCLYDLHHNQPVATYTPDDNFLPMDVCFWHQRDDKLLIADLNNDSIHVVDTMGNNLRFERYLAHGNGHLIKPTALQIDDDGKVLIGCDNGWVLRCEDLPPDELVEDDAMEGAAAACGTSRLRVENASSATSRSQASSSMTEDLNAGIARESTEDDMVLG